MQFPKFAEQIITNMFKDMKLAKWDDFVQTNWALKLEFPELVLEQTEKLLTIIS
jgi:hypothetical protein